MYETSNHRANLSSSSNARAALFIASGLWIVLAAGCWQDVDPGTCNDGFTDPDEECDEGRDNRDPETTLPGRCTWECKIQPGCGDKKVVKEMDEECDDGRMGSEWCTNKCKRKPGCGDGTLDENEECDDGEGNKAIEDAAAGDCTAVHCKRARCGNQLQELGEECDEGSDNKSFKDATVGKCTSTCKYAVCGDGEINADEDCDDGNLDDADGCPTDCSCKDRCGNGVVDLVCGEACDQGADGNDTCTPNCQEHSCGDGVVGPGEMCDNGDNANPETCTNLCYLPGVCGNLVVDAGEECDDGNTDNSDSCIESCKNAVCGDGFEWLGQEACDDGKNDGSYGSCSEDCSAKGPHCGDNILSGPEQCEDRLNLACRNCWLPRTIFITKGVYQGHLDGLTGADEICQWESSYDANTKKFTAWLSRGELAAATRLASQLFSGRYVLFDGTLVAEGWEGLTTADLAHAISMHADGTSLADPSHTWVWTNTTRDGKVAQQGADCSKWKALTGTARAGWVGSLSGGWSNATSSQCYNLNRLYCVEVEP